MKSRFLGTCFSIFLAQKGELLLHRLFIYFATAPFFNGKFKGMYDRKEFKGAG